MNVAIIADMYIKVKVSVGVKKEVIIEDSPDHYTISLREKAEMNRANNRILEIFQDLFPHQPIKIVSGHHSPSKILSVGE